MKKLIKVRKNWIFSNNFNSKKDYYKILDVKKTDDPKDIKKQYYKLVKKNHPDHGGSEEKIKEINEAYEVLSDPQKKKEYDAERAFGGNFNSNNNRSYGSSQNYSQNHSYDNNYYKRQQYENFNRGNSEKDFEEFFRSFGGKKNAYGNANFRQEKYRVFKDQFGNIRYEKVGEEYQRRNPYEQKKRREYGDYGNFNQNQTHQENYQNINFEKVFQEFFQDSKKYYQQKERDRQEREFRDYEKRQKEEYDNLNQDFINKQERLFDMIRDKKEKITESWNVFKHSSTNNGVIKGLYDAFINYTKK